MLLQRNTTTAPTNNDYKNNEIAKVAIIHKVIKANHHVDNKTLTKKN